MSTRTDRRDGASSHERRWTRPTPRRDRRRTSEAPSVRPRPPARHEFADVREGRPRGHGADACWPAPPAAAARRHPTTDPPAVKPAAGSGSNGAALGAAQPGPRVLAERRPVVAALLEDHQPPPEGRRPAGRSRGRHRSSARSRRSGRGRTCRTRARRPRPSPARPRSPRARGPWPRGSPRWSPRRASGMFRFSPAPSPSPVSSARPRKYGYCAVRVGVDRHVADVAAAPEDLLAAVAVVVVDVEDRDPLAGRRARSPRRRSRRC